MTCILRFILTTEPQNRCHVPNFVTIVIYSYLFNFRSVFVLIITYLDLRANDWGREMNQREKIINLGRRLSVRQESDCNENESYLSINKGELSRNMDFI